MSCLQLAQGVGGQLLHAVRTAQILGDVMLHYFEREYKVELDRSELDPFSGLKPEDEPAAIKLEVDRLTNDLAKVYLTTLYPEMGFVGEESYASDPSQMERELFWCVDPICGSKGYRNKTPFFGTSVALVDRNDGPLMGMLNCPALGIMGLADSRSGHRCFEGDYGDDLGSGLKVLVSKNREDNPRFKNALKALSPVRVDYRTGVPPKTLPVLAGAADLYFALPQDMGGGLLKIWDLAASAAVAKAVGAEITDAYGRPLDLTGQSGHIFNQGLILARDADIHRQCLEILSEVCRG